MSKVRTQSAIGCFMSGAQAQSFQRCQGNQVPNCFELSQSPGLHAVEVGPATQGVRPYLPKEPIFPQNRRH